MRLHASPLRPALALVVALVLASPPSASALGRPQDVDQLLRSHCLECHSTAKQKGDLDLETADLKKDTRVWENVLDQIASGEMPPKKERQFSASEKATFTGWIRASLDKIALENAGDPGPVLLRRLSNREYTYSIQDLTGVPSLEPAREFPEDGAAGEGFTNTGAALVMSPALLTKYLDAAKEVAKHLVLTPSGVRFSSSTSSQDWTSETLAQIQALYARFSAKARGSETVQQGIRLDLGDGTGRIPLASYLDALQSRNAPAELSPKYLALLRDALGASDPDPLLDPLRTKFRAGTLTPGDITPWQNVLWRFAQVGHIGKQNGPKAWMEPLSLITHRFESRTKLDGQKATTLYLVSNNAGDGDEGDQVIWENPRLVAQGRPDLPVSSIAPLMAQLEAFRAALIESSVECLNALASGNAAAAPEPHLAAWRDYLGHGPTPLQPLLNQKMSGLPDYGFIKGWVAAADLKVLANPTDDTVHIPGTLRPHTIATQPSAKQEALIAWKSPARGRFKLTGNLTPAHAVCGNGIAWSLEIRRGSNIEVLAKGVSKGARSIPLGPFEDLPLEADQAIAVVIGPRDGDAACDLTSVNLQVSDGTRSWDLVRDVSMDILKSNPNGPWHFLSQPTNTVSAADLPAPIAHWRKFPTPENAARVREHLQKDFPLTSPLLASVITQFKAPVEPSLLEASAPSVLPIEIPAPLAKGAEFVVSGRLKSKTKGSVQLQVLNTPPASRPELLPGTVQEARKNGSWSDNNLASSHSAPIVTNEGTPERERFEKAFERFRTLFPAALCYTRIIPVDEVVTLTLYFREDEPLRRLMLDEQTTRELDRLWDELLYVSEAPLKQVDVFHQLWQFATQDAKPEAFEPLRKPILEGAAAFKEKQRAAVGPQKSALLQLATRAWRRPLSPEETEALLSLEPRQMLTRILVSPSFLYRSEQSPERTGPVTPYELASRLSHFLWASAPDAPLLALAQSGALAQPEVLRSETRRMLADERVRRLATEFGCQWLHVRDLATLSEKSERHFPSFLTLRSSMLEESVRFLTEAIQTNAPVTALLDSDHTFVDAPLAAHYGIPFKGEGWQRVDGLKSRGRGGLLGQAAPLARQSGASRTSPILRGNWVSEVLLGERLPRPPKDVPTLPEEAPAGLTERQLIERHSSDERCSSCHRRIDPIGFALEGFDPIGGSRQRETQTALADGTPIHGLDGLRSYLLEKRRPDFLRQFSRKLLGYALGRSVQLSDKPLIDGVLASHDPCIADLIETIVLSPQFRTIRGAEPQGAE